MISFSDVNKHFAEIIHKKINSNGTEYGSVKNPLSIHRTASNETAIVSEIPNTINDENIIIGPG